MMGGACGRRDRGRAQADTKEDLTSTFICFSPRCTISGLPLESRVACDMESSWRTSPGAVVRSPGRDGFAPSEPLAGGMATSSDSSFFHFSLGCALSWPLVAAGEAAMVVWNQVERASTQPRRAGKIGTPWEHQALI